MLPSTLMWSFQLQSLKLLRQSVKEEIHLQENTLFDLWPWPWGQGHTKYHTVLSTSCDLLTYKVWSCYLLRFRRRNIYKKRDGRTHIRTHGRTDGRRTDFDTKLLYPFFLKKKASITMLWLKNTYNWIQKNTTEQKKSNISAMSPTISNAQHFQIQNHFHFRKITQFVCRHTSVK